MILYEDAMKFIAEKAGTHFDPDLAETFVGLRTQIEEIALRYTD